MTKQRKLFESFMRLYYVDVDLNYYSGDVARHGYTDSSVNTFWQIYQQGWSDKR